MATQKTDIAELAGALVREVGQGIFRPVYALMGDEPYYPDMVCRAILDNCIDEFGKDFNESVLYGADVTPEKIISEAREFPMMSDRRLIVVKEAQMMKGIEELALYCSDPLDSTVLVLLFHQSSLDRRKALYKAVQKNGVVLDSPAVRDYEMSSWIQNYYRSRGLHIDPRAAALLAESVGTDLGAIVLETDKMLRNLPEGAATVSVEDVEKNVGISRQFSVFELTRELSYRHAKQALTIASHLGSSAKFAMPMAVSALYNHFLRILKYSAFASSGASAPAEEKARMIGVSPFFLKEYDTAIRNYSLPGLMAVMGLLCEYDYLGKGGDGGSATPDMLLMELVVKILNCR